ncbi:hypothetical protein B5S30_g718 [[Candida] boidinii]|nr:hypothetical protein B5S30_g718 [[Candida] boidinii]GMG08816.1 unnamed protein product [[Candida] boidinii]
MPHFANNSTTTPPQSRFPAQPTRRKSGLNDQLSQRKSYSSLQQIQQQQQQQQHQQQQFSYSQSSSSSSSVSSNTYNLGPPPATPIANSMGRSRPASSLASFNAKTPSSVVRRPTTPRTTVRSKTSMSNITTPVRSRPSSSLSSHSASSSPNVSYSGTIKVAVRPKPLNDSQLNNHPWTVNQYGNTISSFELGEFSYDKVFDPMVGNSEVFETCVEPVVNQCLDGFNGTIFAYGMTGSGKTYSMQGSENEIGIIPLAAEQIFKRVAKESLLSKHYKISCSYLEIYNERIFDLLNPESSNKLKQSSYSSSSIGLSSNNSSSNNTDELKIRNDSVYGVKVMGLREIQVETSEELIKVIEGGDSIRRTGGTDFNARSSRSHAVLMIRILCVDGNKERFSSLCLCDLAGSEKATTQQERRKEGSFINKSLLALSTVVSKLSQQSSQPQSSTSSSTSTSLNSSSSTGGSGSSSSNIHIPYRDSKLTRLLQPSLSGNSVVSILCTIHLSQNTYSETLNTLRFAARAKNISLSAKKNEISSLQSMPNSEKDKLVHQLMRENELQKIEIEALKLANDGVKTSLFGTATSSSSSTSDNSTPLVNNGRRVSSNSGGGQYDKFSDEFSQLTAENKILNEQVEHLRRMSDYSKLDSIMINNEKLNLLSTQFEVRENGEEFRQIINSLENYYRTQVLQVEEMKSYISHLEQSLRIAEYDRQVSINSSVNELNNGNSVLENLVKDQEEEILSLKRSLGSKDSIIDALKSASRLRDTVSSHSSNHNYSSRISSRNGEDINSEVRNITGSVNDNNSHNNSNNNSNDSNNNNTSNNYGNENDEQKLFDSNDENLDISRATKKAYLQPIENKLSSNNN